MASDMMLPLRQSSCVACQASAGAPAVLSEDISGLKPHVWLLSTAQLSCRVLGGPMLIGQSDLLALGSSLQQLMRSPAQGTVQHAQEPPSGPIAWLCMHCHHVSCLRQIAAQKADQTQPCAGLVLALLGTVRDWQLVSVPDIATALDLVKGSSREPRMAASKWRLGEVSARMREDLTALPNGA